MPAEVGPTLLEKKYYEALVIRRRLLYFCMNITKRAINKNTKPRNQQIHRCKLEVY